MFSFHAKAALAAGSALLLGTGAEAVSYQGNAQSFSNGGTTSTPATYSFNDIYRSAVSITGSAGGGSAYASGSTVSPGITSAFAQVDYTFQIVGSELPYALPVAVSAGGYVDGSGFDFSAYDEFKVVFESPQAPDGTYYPGIDQTLESASFSPYTPGKKILSYNNTILMPTNVNINVTLLANVNVGGCCAADGTPSMATAFLDPTFTLVGNPAGYSIVGVPGAGGVAAAPEPAGWAMMIVGFGAIGVTRRRRQRMPRGATTRAGMESLGAWHTR